MNKHAKMKIALVSGGFDPIYLGHIEYFKATKLPGDKLIVADKSEDIFLTNYFNECENCI